MFKFLQQYLQKLFAMKDVREDHIMKPLVPLSELCVSVFFDTNQLGERFNDDGCGNMIVHRIRASKDFYTIQKFTHKYGLASRVSFLFPEISLKEYKRQSVEIFIEHTKSLEDKVEKYKKVFGENLSVNFSFAHKSTADFEAFIERLIQQFMLENQCLIAHHNANEETFKRFVDKVINREPPFTDAHKGSKKYKDAGFKDAVIEDTIKLFSESTNNVCILLSEDNDWRRCFKKDCNNIYVCKNADQVIDIICKSLSLGKLDLIASMFLNNSYIKETSITMANLKYEELSLCENIEVDENTDDETYMIRFDYIMDNKTYKIETVYEESSNSVISSIISDDDDLQNT